LPACGSLRSVPRSARPLSAVRSDPRGSGLPQSRYVRAVSRPLPQAVCLRSIRHFRSPRHVVGLVILLLVYPALAANALAHLPEAIPALAKRFPVLIAWSDFILSRTRLVVPLASPTSWLASARYLHGILLVLSRAPSLEQRLAWSALSVLRPLYAAALLHGFSFLPRPARNCQRSPTSALLPDAAGSGASSRSKGRPRPGGR